MDRAYLCFLLVFMACSLLVSTQAQSAANSSQIVGQILDPSSASVVGAQVTVRNKSTNYARITTTDMTGRYAISDMPLGPYEVEAHTTGLQTTTEQVIVTLESSVTTNFRLSIAARTESVEVNAQTPGIEPTRTAAISILTELQLRELPSNGRRVQNNVLETPATLIEPECRWFSVSGQKGIYASINIDGGDYNSTWGCGIRGRSESAPNFSLEALEELQL
jgi:hypothetical protein